MQSTNENAAVIGTIMSGIYNFVKDVNKGASDSSRKRRNKDNNTHLTKSSIMSASKDLVMSFPVICSTALSADTALMIQKAIESNCVSTLQMIFAAASLQGDSGVEVIKQWHNNISGDVSIDDYFEYIDNIGNGLDSAIQKRVFECDYAAIQRKYGETMIAECKRNEVFYPVTNFSENSLLSYELSNGYDGRLNIKAVHEAGGKGPAMVTFPYTDPYGYTQYISMPKDVYDTIKKEADRTGVALQYTQRAQEFFEKQKVDAARIENELDRNITDINKYNDQKLANKTNLLQHQLLDSDIKKANELQPTMMIIRYTVASKTSQNFHVEDQFVAGVKARLIGCDSVEIIDRIRLATENKVNLKNFVRATTGEIRFCKDFLLAIDQAKIEAKRNSKLSKTSPIWRALQTRSTKSTMKRLGKGTNTAAAITSLVITAEECNRLNTLYNIDMLNVGTCREVMQAYNFMEVVIVDEALEVARFLLDNNDKYFQDYSFTALRKEISDTEMKKLINIMSTTNRG